jgi:glycosyltransferase involved in cell wall biosynthesis
VRNVVILQKLVLRYREPFYEQLRERLHGVGIGLRVIEARPDDPIEMRGTPADLAWAERAPARLFTVRGRRLIWQPVLGRTRDADLIVVEQASQLLVNYLLLARQSAGGPRLAFWGHGQHHGLWASSRIGEGLKRFTSRRADWWFAYTEGSAEVVAALGFPRERITIVRNSTDTVRLRRLIETATASDVATLRADLGVRGRRIGIFVGSLEWDKRLDYLIEAADHLRGLVPDFELVIVGGGPRREWVERMVAARPWAHLTGVRFDRELAALLSTSSALLVPASAGLVVVDSFGAGVPLVASTAFPHGPEMEYLDSGSNGLLVKDDADPERYAAAAAALLLDEPRRQRLVEGCRSTADQLGVEQMVERFARGVEKALAD